MRIVILLLLAILATPAAASAQSLEGVWSLTEYESENLNPAEPHGLMIFADGHYSRVYVRSAEPREPLGDSPTPEQLVQSIGPFISNSGTYTLSGSTLTLQIDVAKVVGVIGSSATAEVEFDGNSIWLTGTLEGINGRQRWERVN